MENSEQGRRRWTAVLRFALKIVQMSCAITAIILCATFNETARVQMVNTDYYYKISLQFPFIYDSNSTVQESPELQLEKFSFPKSLLPSTLVFVIATALAFIIALILFTLHIFYYHGSQDEQEHIKKEFFSSLVMTSIMAASISLWLVNLVKLVHDVKQEVNSLLHRCSSNGGNCEKREPEFITLYLCSAFAILNFIMWLVESILIFIKMVYTIPAQITLTALVRNVELDMIDEK